ncbi:MAG TPA: 4Fe-4S dicluster domain-containing protein [Usitatibacteraceae bacterium]|nr:4Fe-4S dicluster domain-containing protein [Usitatibacteraceae bacterium]
MRPELHQSRCTRYRFRYSECRRCADACPHDAIAFSDEGASIDAARCRNCALCTSACRTGAWESPEVPRVDLLKRAIKAPAWSFACAPSGAEADAVVPCLGALDAAMLAYLGKRGIPVELRGMGRCASCEHGERGAAMIEVQLEAVDLLGRASGEQWAQITIAEAEPAERPAPTAFAPGRRHLFRRILGGVATEVREAAKPVASAEAVPAKAIRAARAFVTESRELLQIVARTKDATPLVVREHEALPLASLAIAGQCTACEACFRACPTGALQIRESDSAWSLAFALDKCVGCGVCLEVCQPRVLHTKPEFDIGSARPEAVLHSLGRQRCARCDRLFTSPRPQHSCGVCTDDEEAFDAIFS